MSDRGETLGARSNCEAPRLTEAKPALQWEPSQDVGPVCAPFDSLRW